MRTSIRKTLLASFAVTFVAACSGSSSGNPGQSLTITGVGWVEENIDPSYWSSPLSNPAQTAFYNFWIHYSGDIAFTDIQSARVYLPGTGGAYWPINYDPRLFDATNKTIGGWGHWYGSQTNLLPIGPLQVEVKLNGGAVANYTANIPAPASLTAGSYTAMYTDLALPPADSAPMIDRATLGATQTFDTATQTITVTFSVNDPKVYDGYVWFFDASRNYLGGFFYFVDPATGLASPRLAGSTFYIDGTTNTLTLTPYDVMLSSGVAFGQIAQVRVGLTDGAQYAQSGRQPSGNLQRDCRSVSEIRPLTVQ